MVYLICIVITVLVAVITYFIIRSNATLTRYRRVYEFDGKLAKVPDEFGKNVNVYILATDTYRFGYSVKTTYEVCWEYRKHDYEDD